MQRCYKRQKPKWKRIAVGLVGLKNDRKRKSDHLQRWLFSQFTFLNAQGEHSDLLSIFRNYYLLHSPKSVLATHYAAYGRADNAVSAIGNRRMLRTKITSICFYTWYATSRNGDVLVGRAP